MLKYTFRFIEQSYAESKKKPLMLNFVLFKKSLTKEQVRILEKQFTFYSRLSHKEQLIFRHRVATFINNKSFYGRDGLELTDEIIVLISATAVKLTFGFRDYSLSIIKAVLVYPEAFYSKINEQLHKGEVNPMLGVLALSWKDFKQGYDIANDNLNLGIHEFSHAIHLNSFKNNDISSLIFRDGFKALKRYLKENETKRQELISTKYFRAYAYTNEYEFMAVLIECFIETPDEFRTIFPNIYNTVKEMLNFNFADY
ncbi:zinc-dependent peptidase [uncultured Winogradskyella sp.]|uniref:zinc-dependent peptidase n=1 Tax=uncultured Winogradskyella sp. TaxID=395353 RepID=UPI00351A8E7A